MNCQPGDLAMIVHPPAWAGKMVVVIERGYFPDGKHTNRQLRDQLWRVDRQLRWHYDADPSVGLMLPLCPDSYLMPIRPEADPEAVQTEEEIEL